MRFHSLFLGSRTRLAMAGVLVLAVFAPSLRAADAPGSPFPGLQPVDSKNVDRLYRRPDVDLSAYGKIMIGEPVVDFSKNWNPRNYGTFGLSAAQVKRIRVDLAAAAKSTFSKVLGEGGYEIVADAGDGVLEVTPNILDVYINAPATQSAGRSKSYTMEAGSATLALQVNDAVTGTLLAVAYDRQRSQSSSFQWATSVSNRAAAESMLKSWAEQFKRELDSSRAK
jgi:hypothetical protein